MHVGIKHYVRISLVAATAATLALSGCSVINGPTSSGGDCASYQKYGSYPGTTVSVLGSVVNVEADRLNESWADFARCTGINVVYEGATDFSDQIAARVGAGNAPDLALAPQPELVSRLARSGSIVPAPQSVAENVRTFWPEGWARYGTVDGTLYGAPLLANLKGYIWYSPSTFEKNGWQVPTTLDGLQALTAQIASSGAMKPWCAGFASGAATGWPGSDWMEDLVLRRHGTETYDRWVSHAIPFNDPSLIDSLDSVGSYIRSDANVNAGFGDVASIAATDFGTAGLPVLEGTCALHHQASFYENFWPSDTTVAPDGQVWAFLMPGTNPDTRQATVSGETVIAFRDKPEVQAVQTYLSSDTWANNRVELGGVMSANTGVDPANASSQLLRSAMELLRDPNAVLRFDASELMPATVGTGTFWRGMVDWIGGKSTSDTLTSIEESWP